jgi:hypothetical protein
MQWLKPAKPGAVNITLRENQAISAASAFLPQRRTPIFQGVFDVFHPAFAPKTPF